MACVASPDAAIRFQVSSLNYAIKFLEFLESGLGWAGWLFGSDWIGLVIGVTGHMSSQVFKAQVML
jgi:hypothetical protein